MEKCRAAPVQLRPATAEFGCRIPPPRRRFDRREPDPDPRTPSARPPSRRSPGGHRGTNLHSAPTARPRGPAGGALFGARRMRSASPPRPSAAPPPISKAESPVPLPGSPQGRRSRRRPPWRDPLLHLPSLCLSGTASALAYRAGKIRFHTHGRSSAHRLRTKPSTRRPRPDSAPLPISIPRRSP